MCCDWREALREVDPGAADAFGPETTGVVEPTICVGEDAAREWLGRQLPGPNVLLVPGPQQAGWILPLLRCKESMKVLWLDSNVKRFAKALDAMARHEPQALLEMLRSKRLRLDPGEQAESSIDRFVEVADFTRRPCIRILDAEVVDPSELDMLAEMTKGARDLIRYEACDLATRMKFGVAWQDQTIRNIPAIVRQSPLKMLFGAFTGKPAVVVAAGPSLADAIPFLARHRHRVVVVCVGRVLTHLVYRAGIMPDLVVTGDGQDYVVQHFKRKPRQIPVVASSFTDPDAVKDLDRVFFMEIESMNLPKWIRSKIGELGEVFPGGNVSTAAMAVAEVMGCNPILTAGLDLSYPTDGRTHVAGRSKTIEPEDPDFVPRNTYLVPGNYREKVETNRQMLHYIDFTGEFVQNHPHTTFVNINTDGARIEGMILDQPDALENYLGGPVNAASRIARLYREGRWDAHAAAHCRESLGKDIPQLQSLRKACLDAAMVCNQLIMLVRQPGMVADPEARLHELLGILKPLDQRLHYDEVMHLLDARLENANHLLSERMLSASDLLLAPAVRSHKRWREYYMEVARACEKTERLLQGAIDLMVPFVCRTEAEVDEEIKEMAV